MEPSFSLRVTCVVLIAAVFLVVATGSGSWVSAASNTVKKNKKISKPTAEKSTGARDLPTPEAVATAPEMFEGALVKGSAPDVFVIEHGLKRRIPSMEVLRAFHFENRTIERVSAAALESFIAGEPLGLFSSWPDRTLLKGSGPRVYLVLKNTRRWVVNESVFRAWGLRFDRITAVSDDVLGRLAEGPPVIGPAPNPPETTILSGPEHGAVLETASVTVTFTGATGQGTRDVNFETYLKGFDRQWVGTTRTERSFDLERKDGTYTLFVRAISKEGEIDPTPASRSFSTRFSPFARSVRLVSFSGTATSPDNETMTIEVLGSAPAPVDLSEYAVSNSLGHSFRLPRVYNEYRASQGLPPPDPLLVAPGGRVLVTIGKTSIGQSVRVNRCTPYLGRSPGVFGLLGSFLGDCPLLPRDFVERLTGKACADYVFSQGACSIPNPVPFPDNVRLGASCIDFVSRHYTYNGCVDDHALERDFYKNEWRVDIGFPRDFFPTGRERVELRDRDGKLVDRREPFFSL